jgi:hypothetical protein
MNQGQTTDSRVLRGELAERITMRGKYVAASIAVLWVAMSVGAAAQANRPRVFDPAGVLINVANPASPFATDKAAEASVAIDKAHPNVIGAGAFDEADEAPCGTVESTPTSPCPFISGVGTSGAYFSFDYGHTWTQPATTGWTARDGTAHFGTIYTLPWYYEAGITSDADSAVAFGPAPVNGQFSWDNGSRFYYANLVSNNGLTSETINSVFEGVGVSRIDNPTSPEVVSNKDNWFRPVLIPAHVSKNAFQDKEQIWADNAASSPFFGNVYVCYADYRSFTRSGQANVAQPLIVARSTDGGDTWSKKQETPAGSDINSQLTRFGSSGCTIRTDSHGVVYVFAERFDEISFLGQFPFTDSHMLMKSYDGGQTWTRPRAIFDVTDPCFHFDPVQGRCTGDGNAGGRIDLSGAPSVDIANGAPTGEGATNEIVDSWVDGREGDGNEEVLFSYSTDGARSWSDPITVPGPGRGFYSAPAISPSGTQVYVANSWFLTDFQEDTANPRILVNTLDQSALDANGAPTGFSAVVTGVPGDARGGSSNGLTSEFLGDYNYASATDSYGIGVWTADARNAADCPAVDAYRHSLYTDSPLPKPNPATDCPGSFGNIDIYGATTG